MTYKLSESGTAVALHTVGRVPPRRLSLGCLLACAGLAGSEAAAQSSVLEEIVVTALKREQSAQDVGLSLAVLDADALRALGISALPEAAAYIANAELFEDFTGAGQPTWVIRGVGLQDFNSNNTPTAAVYFDESYQSATIMGGAALFDMERLEVLKGPQGGLYGRNTSGGAVLLSSRRAELGERSSYVSLGVGSWQSRSAEAAFNLPLGEQAAWRLAGRAVNSAGSWQHSLPDGREHGEQDNWDLRSWLSWEASDSLSVEWKLQGGKDSSEILLGRSIGVYAPGGQPCQAILEGRRDDASCLSWAGVNRLDQGLPPPDLLRQTDDGSRSLSDPLNQQANDYLGTALHLRWDLGSMQLLSLTTVDVFHYGVDLDLDASPGEYGHRFSSSDITLLGQEFRLKSASEQRLQWLLGLVLNDEHFEERRDFLLRDNLRTPLPVRVGKLAYDQGTDSQSLYGNLTYALSDTLSLNASLRYTREDKAYRNGSFYLVGASPIYLVRGAASDYKLDDPWSGRVGLDWHYRPNLMLYVSISQGFKSGGFYGGFPFNLAELEPYGEETILAYEAGFKSDWPGGLRLNGALFHYDYRDVQGFTREINPLTGTGIDLLGNQGDAEHQGAELQVSWQPLDGLSLDLGLGYLDAAFDYEGMITRGIGGSALPITGRRPYAPRWSGSAALRLETSPGTAWRSVGTLGYHYRSDFSGHHALPAEAAVNHLPGYGLFDARWEVQPLAGDWSVALWARNLLDKRYRTRVKNDGLSSFAEFFGEPRSVGGSFSYRW